MGQVMRHPELDETEDGFEQLACDDWLPEEIRRHAGDVTELAPGEAWCPNPRCGQQGYYSGWEYNAPTGRQKVTQPKTGRTRLYCSPRCRQAI